MTARWITDRLPNQIDTFTREEDPAEGQVLTLLPTGIIDLVDGQKVPVGGSWMRRYFDD
jgi:hypothetical protein